MPHLVFAGLGVEHVQQVFRAGPLALPEGWTCEFVRNKTRREVVIDSVEAVLRVAEKSQDTHICGASRKRGRHEISDQIRSHFRFRWVAEEQLAKMEAARFSNVVEVLTPILAEEAEWGMRVKPSASSDCLLLPKSCFSHEPRSDVWEFCEAYNDPAAIESALRAIERFRTRYWRRGKQEGDYPAHWQWVDNKEIIFDHRGERHGIPPFPRGWKYSHRIEDGLHFDLSHLDGRPFGITDATLRSARALAGKHLNVDCHGHLR